MRFLSFRPGWEEVIALQKIQLYCLITNIFLSFWSGILDGSEVSYNYSQQIILEILFTFDLHVVFVQSFCILHIVLQL